VRQPPQNRPKCRAIESERLLAREKERKRDREKRKRERERERQKEREKESAGGGERERNCTFKFSRLGGADETCYVDQPAI
jgi:hypothetical protein